MADLNPLAFQQAQQAAIGTADSIRQNRLQQMAFQRAEDQYQQEQAANRLYAAAVGPDGNIDRTKLVTGFAQGGLGSKIPALQTQFAAQDKALREADKAKLESIKQHVELQGQLLGGVKDQATYDAARQQAAQAGIDVSQLPPQYDPAFVQQATQKALTAAQQVEQMWKQKGYDLDQQKFAYQQGNDAANRGVQLQGQQVTMRGQDMNAATAAANREAQANRAGTKEAEGQKLRVQDANDALGLLDQAEKLIPGATGSYLGAGRDVALRTIGAATDAGNAAAQLRALEGALVSKMPRMSGPQSDKDVAMYRQMAGQIGDPTVPAETKLAAIKTIREIQNRYAGNATPAAPVAGAPVAQDAAIQELRRRAASDPALAAKLKAMGY